MKKKKRYIILLIILIIYGIGMYYWLGKDNLQKEKTEITLLVGENTIWKYSAKKWRNTENPTSVKKINWQKFSIYVDNEKLGNYYVWHDDKWYLFTEKKEAISYEGTLLGIQSNRKIKVKPFTEEEILDYTYVNQVLKENGITNSGQFTINTQTKVDIDNDGTEEEFYIISNVFALDFTPDTIFSIVFMVKEGKIYTLYNDIDKNRGENGCKPYIKSFLDVDQDNQEEIILSCGRYSIQETVDMLYKLENNQFKILISNQ